MEGKATIQNRAEVLTEIVNTIEREITKVLEQVDRKYLENQVAYTEAIDSSMQQRRSQVVTGYQREKSEDEAARPGTKNSPRRECGGDPCEDGEQSARSYWADAG